MPEPKEGNSIPEPKSAESFLDEIANADGRVFHLAGKQSRVGEDYYVTLRIGNTDFWGEDVQRLLIVDMLVMRNGNFYPVAYYDWEIKIDSAKGHRNRHGYLPAVNEAHIAADGFWTTAEAFKTNDQIFVNYATQLGKPYPVDDLRQRGIITDHKQLLDPVYQKHNIGSLLIALSAYTLIKQGVSQSDFVSVSNVAKRAWSRFGVEAEQKAQLSQVTSHPYFKEVVTEFTLLPFTKT